MISVVYHRVITGIFVAVKTLLIASVLHYHFSSQFCFWHFLVKNLRYAQSCNGLAF